MAMVHISLSENLKLYIVTKTMTAKQGSQFSYKAYLTAFLIKGNEL